jgi:hypothetical protein
VPLTTVEAGKLGRQDSLKSGIVDIFREGKLYAAMPQLPVAGTGIHYNQEQTLPGIGFRGVNEAYSESTGIINPQSEALKIFGGDVDIDLALEAMQGPEIRTAQVAMKVKAARLKLEKTLIKGDSTSHVNEFDGLQARIPSGSSQLIFNADNGAALSLSALDELIDAVDETVGSPVLIMNRTLRRRLSAAARVASAVGNLQYGQDALGRQQYSYNGVPIIDVDYDETGAQILAFNETRGNSSACSSIYCVAAGVNGATLITNGGINVRDLGEIDTKPVRRIRVEAYLGMAVFHPRAIARLGGITNAPVAA